MMKLRRRFYSRVFVRLEARIVLTPIFLLAPLVVFSSEVMGSGGESREFAYVLVDAAKKVLVEHGLCKSASDCTSKKFIFFEAEQRNAVHLSLYNVRDVKVIEGIIAVCIQHFEKNGQTAIVLSVRTRSHDEYGLWQKFVEDPFVELRLKRK